MTVEVNGKEVATVVQKAIRQHGAEREAIIPILTDVNRAFGYIPPEAFVQVRKSLQESEGHTVVSEGQLFSVASFYELLATEPLGRHVVRFCESAPCHVMGGRELFGRLKAALELEPGQTSPDKQWSLITTSCLGICGVGPVILIDEDVYGNVRPEQLPGILARYA